MELRGTRNQLIIKVPKFLVKDDLLEVTTYPYFSSGMKTDGNSVKFYRTVQTPYSQTITLTWTVEDTDNYGNIRKKDTNLTCRTGRKNDPFIDFFLEKLETNP